MREDLPNKVGRAVLQYGQILNEAPSLIGGARRVWRREGARHVLRRAREYLRRRNLQQAFDERGPWVTGFTIEEVQYGGSYNAVEDPRLALFLNEISVEGKRILELGPLEGGHTVALTRAGAREVVAIEGRPENLARSLLIKNVFGLKNVTFLLGDVRDVTRDSHGPFDIAIASGVLYHLPDPDRLLAHLAEIAPLTLLWTHVADEEHPANANEATLASPYGSFRGKVYIEDITHPLSAVDREVIWLYRQDLLDLIRAVGFQECKILQEWPDQRCWDAMNSQLQLQATPLPGPALIALLSV